MALEQSVNQVEQGCYREQMSGSLVSLGDALVVRF